VQYSYRYILYFKLLIARVIASPKVGGSNDSPETQRKCYSRCAFVASSQSPTTTAEAIRETRLSLRENSSMAPSLPVRTVCEHLFRDILILTLGRQCVKQRFTYPGCNAHDSASFAHGPVNRTCSVARVAVGPLHPCLSSRSHGVAAFP